MTFYSTYYIFVATYVNLFLTDVPKKTNSNTWIRKSRFSRFGEEEDEEMVACYWLRRRRVGHKYRESSPVHGTDNFTIPLSKARPLLSNYSNSCSRIFKKTQLLQSLTGSIYFSEQNVVILFCTIHQNIVFHFPLKGLKYLLTWPKLMCDSCKFSLCNTKFFVIFICYL